MYYTAPSEEIFEEVKKACIEIWGEYEDTYGYASEKINRIKDINNIKDNVMFMIAMFDHINIGKLADKLSNESKKAIRERLLSVDNEELVILFN